MKFYKLAENELELIVGGALSVADDANEDPDDGPPPEEPPPPPPPEVCDHPGAVGLEVAKTRAADVALPKLPC